jgi:PKD repeat protein
MNPCGIAAGSGNSIFVADLGNSRIEKFITAFAPVVVPIPGYVHAPTDPDHDGIYEDLNGNGETDFDDVVALFKHMDWIETNEPVSAFDFNGNGSLDFDDIIRLFREV